MDIEKKKVSIDHVEDVGVPQAEGDKSQDMHEMAQKATDAEHSETLWEAIKFHRAAILWSAVSSGTIIMESYDNILMTSFFAYPEFRKAYGVEINGEYELQSKWQVALGCASTVGIICGVFVNGYLAERFGHRRVIMAALVIMSGFIFIPFFATPVEMLLVGQIMCGLPWGVFATMGIAYSSEVCPLSLRGYLTSYVNVCWATGQFIAAGILQALVSNTTKWSYKIPFAIQWVWPIPLFILTFLAPDSPWWLIRRGRIEDAERSVRRLSSKKISHKVHDSVAMMIKTNELEMEEKKQRKNEISGIAAYLECFKNENLRRTEIGCVTFAAQVLSGSTFAYSPTYFFSQAGLSSDDTYKLNLGTTGIAFSGTVCSWFLLKRFGRRTIYLTGFFILTTSLLLIGVLGFPAESNSKVRWAQAVITLLWVATYSLSIGPLAFTIVSEISSTRLRSQSIALSRNSYNVMQLISYVAEPYLINPGDANLKGKTAFVWFGTAFPTLIWIFFRLPETKGRTFEELDIMFKRGVRTRQFATYDIMEHSEEQEEIIQSMKEENHQ